MASLLAALPLTAGTEQQRLSEVARRIGLDQLLPPLPRRTAGLHRRRAQHTTGSSWPWPPELFGPGLNTLRPLENLNALAPWRT